MASEEESRFEAYARQPEYAPVRAQKVRQKSFYLQGSARHLDHAQVELRNGLYLVITQHKDKPPELRLGEELRSTEVLGEIELSEEVVQIVQAAVTAVVGIGYLESLMEKQPDFQELKKKQME
jgi:hypothetical protein